MKYSRKYDHYFLKYKRLSLFFILKVSFFKRNVLIYHLYIFTLSRVYWTVARRITTHRMYCIFCMRNFVVFFSVSEIFCEMLTKCKGTGGKCKSSKTKGIHCECGINIEYDETFGCKGKTFYIMTKFSFHLSFLW